MVQPRRIGVVNMSSWERHVAWLGLTRWDGESNKNISDVVVGVTAAVRDECDGDD